MHHGVNNTAAEYVTVMLGGQLFGLPISRVQDVFKPDRLTRVPLAPPEIAGVLNLRGRIVTAIDMRGRLALPERDGKRPPRSARRHPKKLRKPLPIKRPRHRCRDSTKRIAGDENRRSFQKNLTRRANHRHIFIIARIEPAPGNRPRVF